MHEARAALAPQIGMPLGIVPGSAMVPQVIVESSDSLP
jgi:hypothetical protein